MKATKAKATKKSAKKKAVRKKATKKKAPAKKGRKTPKKSKSIQAPAPPTESFGAMAFPPGDDYGFDTTESTGTMMLPPDDDGSREI